MTRRYATSRQARRPYTTSVDAKVIRAFRTIFSWVRLWAALTVSVKVQPTRVACPSIAEAVYGTLLGLHGRQRSRGACRTRAQRGHRGISHLSLIHISEPTRRTPISYAV